VAPDCLALRPKRPGRACQQLRASAALLIEWLRVTLRAGLLGGPTRVGPSRPNSGNGMVERLRELRVAKAALRSPDPPRPSLAASDPPSPLRATSACPKVCHASCVHPLGPDLVPFRGVHMGHSRRKLISSTPDEAPGSNLQTLTKTTVVGLFEGCLGGPVGLRPRAPFTVAGPGLVNPGDGNL
jgi:hypothetical protein